MRLNCSGEAPSKERVARRGIIRSLPVRAPVALVRARIGIEDGDAPVDVTVGDEHLVRLGVVSRLRRRGEVLRIVAPVALSEMANLEEEFSVLVELQDLRVAFAVAADPEVALRVDRQPVLVHRPLVAGARPSPSLEEPAVLVELHHEGRRHAAIGGGRRLHRVVLIGLEGPGRFRTQTWSFVGSTNTPPIDPKIQFPSNLGQDGSTWNVGTPPAGFWARAGRAIVATPSATTARKDARQRTFAFIVSRRPGRW